jgi:enamine deaminase RidA (YjgF/YER057c/UK114 family)
MSDKSTLAGADARFLALPDEKPPLMQVPAGLSFVRARRSNGLIWLAGHAPLLKKRPPEFDFMGKVGSADLPIEEGVRAARLVGLNLLVSLRDALGSLDYVDTVLQVIGAVNSAESFHQQSKVLNGCTNLMVEVFQDAGKPARMAFGAYELPFNMAVEASMVVSIRSD